MLWGATYRITQSFLERVFDFARRRWTTCPWRIGTWMGPT
jgi:hypothetical protein